MMKAATSFVTSDRDSTSDLKVKPNGGFWREFWGGLWKTSWPALCRTLWQALPRLNSIAGALFALFILFYMAASQPASAQGLKVLEEKPLPNAELEARARDYMHGIRCLVCQNQSIEESDADMARDLRILIRERFANGETEDQITHYLVERYGDWILMNPPLSSKTWLLWSAPLLILVTALLFLWSRRRHPTTPTPEKTTDHKVTGLSADEEQRLKDILNQGDDT